MGSRGGWVKENAQKMKVGKNSAKESMAKWATKILIKFWAFGLRLSF
jgi:hypothetical protein